MKFINAVLFTLLFGVTFAQEKVLDYELEKQIPLDTTVVRGQLDNGLKYFIKKNDRPKQMVEMRLVIKVGSLQEDEDQLGLAHILEHLLFNGTKHFPKHKLIEFLESIGLKFGADLNAHTGFDETVYKLSIPTENIENVNTAFQILEDWAHNALLEDEEIEAERGVVMEEYRARLEGLNERIYSKILGEMYKGTREADRLPIGTEESILNFEPQRLRDFYNEWYRPNLMAITIVGDIDLDFAEGKIKEHFEKLENPKGTRELQEFGSLPRSEEKKVIVLADPELTRSSTSISFVDDKRKPVDGALVKEEYESIVVNLLNQMLNNRFQEIAYQKDAPFLSGGVYRSGTLIKNLAAYAAGVSSAEGKMLPAITGLFTELERAKRFGFTEVELENAKKNILASNETMLSRKDERYSKRLTGTLISEYKGDWALGDVDWNYNFVKEVVPTIDLKTIESKYAELYHDFNQKVLLFMPEKEGLEVPTESAVVKSIVTAEDDKSIEAYKGKELESSLIKNLKPKGTIASEETLEHDIKKLVLSNGIELYYKKTDFDTDYVAFKAYSYGGTSLWSDEEAKTIAKVKSLVTTTGVGGFKPYELRKMLSGKKVRESSYVGKYDEGLNGNSKVVDMETLFQLIYLDFVAVNKDEDTYRLFGEKRKESIKNSGLDAKNVFRNKIWDTYYEGNPRYLNIYENDNYARILDNSDYDEVYKSYTDRFKNAGDFKFFFIGDFEEAVLKEYASTYLASLPNVGEHEEYKLHPFSKELKEKRITVYKGLGDKGKVMMNYEANAVFNAKENKALQIFGTILKRKLRNKIREEKGGTYGVSANMGHRNRDIPHYWGSISFECDPTKIDELEQAAMQVVDDFLAEGPTKEEVESVVEQWALGRKKQLRQNKFWLNKMRSTVYWNKPVSKMFDDFKLNTSISHKYIKKIANKYIDKPSVIAKLLPESFEKQ